MVTRLALALELSVCLIGLSESFVPGSNMPTVSTKHIAHTKAGQSFPIFSSSIRMKDTLVLQARESDENDANGESNDSSSELSITTAETNSETTKKEDSKRKNEDEWNTSLFPMKMFYPPPELTLDVEPIIEEGRKRTKVKRGAKKIFERLSSKKKIKTISPAELYDERRFRLQIRIQGLAAMVGLMAGVAVSGFKMGIETVKEICYTDGLPVLTSGPLASYVPVFAITTLGGVMVAILASLGPFPPGVKGEIDEVDDASLAFFDELHYRNENEIRDSVNQDTWEMKLNRFDPAYAFGFVRKAFASIFTLGTGCSLGPEGPSVEVAMAMSRVCMFIFPPETVNANGNVEEDEGTNGSASTSFKYSKEDVQARIRRNRLLLSCGAAAGVSAGFNAPLAGVFFALEVVQAALPSFTVPQLPTKSSADSSELVELEQESLSGEPSSITAILIASVVSGLIARVLLGNELALVVTDYEIKTPLLELPLYLLQGGLSGLVAVAFSQSAKLAKQTFDESFLPKFAKPIIGGLICGIVGIFRPEVFFFGYETLNGLLSNNAIPTVTLLSLLIAKIFTTAVSAGSGLVGGTFAPSLFLGGMCGASFHNIVQWIFDEFDLVGINGYQLLTPMGIVFELADVPAYAMVGAASTLAALFGAPLTASLLLFELTRNYDILIPLLASAGVGSLVSDIVENKIEAQKYNAKQLERSAQ